MNHNLVKAGLFALGFLAADVNFAKASVVVDVSDTDVSSGLLSVFNVPGKVQSFTADATNIAGADIFLDPRQGRGAGTGTISIEIYTDIPNAADSTEIAFGSVTASAGQIATVNWTPVATTVGAVYYLAIQSSNGFLGVDGSVNNPYPGGSAYDFGSEQNLPDFDYAFQTFTETTPLPAALPLFAGGLGLLGFVGWRRKRGIAAAAA
jgi:hypothetical protein